MPSISIIGFGKLGQFIAEWIRTESSASGGEGAKRKRGADGTPSLAAVYTRRPLDLATVDGDLRTFLVEKKVLLTQDLGEAVRRCEVAVEVASASVYDQLAPLLVGRAKEETPFTFFMGSPAAMGHCEPLTKFVSTLAADESSFTLLLGVPSGAAWGLADVRSMARAGKVARVTVTMEKHPGSLKIVDSAAGGGSAGDEVRRLVEESAASGSRVEAYRGPVGPLTQAAPQNVNTMSVLALASLGFEQTEGVLVADPTLTSHDIRIDVWGHPSPADPTDAFHVSTLRHNPAAPGAVTGSATYFSFVSSLDSLLTLRARGFDGLQFC